MKPCLQQKPPPEICPEPGKCDRCLIDRAECPWWWSRAHKEELDMPRKPRRPCSYPGCPHLTDDKSGYCPEHLKQARRQYDRGRGSAASRGYGRRWRRYTRAYLAEHPLCALCARKKPPVVRAASVVDHIKPHRGDYDLFWDEGNHQPACKECHDIKTASEDGGFGNEPASR